MSLRKVLFALALAGGMLLPAVAQAAVSYAATALNMRTGPGTGYARIAVIPGGGAVEVYSCTRGWCRVNWAGRVGWVSASYLTASYAPRRYYSTPAPYYYGGYPHSGFSFFFGTSPRYYSHRQYRQRHYPSYRHVAPRRQYYAPRHRSYGNRYPGSGYGGGSHVGGGLKYTAPALGH